jgi:hypothetical protein
VFPYIFVTDARSYLTFLVQGLGGEVSDVVASPEGVVRNAHVRFGDTTIMVSEAQGRFEPSRGTYYLTSRTPMQPWLVRSQPADGLSGLSPTCPTTIDRVALRILPVTSGGCRSAW